MKLLFKYRLELTLGLLYFFIFLRSVKLSSFCGKAGF